MEVDRVPKVGGIGQEIHARQAQSKAQKRRSVEKSDSTETADLEETEPGRADGSQLDVLA